MESQGEVVVPPAKPAVPTNPWGNTASGVSTSPWGNTASGVSTSPWKRSVQFSPQPCSLADVMSEELAKELQKDEEKTVLSAISTSDEIDFDVTLLQDDNQDTTNDLLLAQMLQLEYDKEHDKILKKEEAHINKDSKVSLSFANYRSTHPALEEEDNDDEDTWEEEIEPLSKGSQKSTSRKGYTGKGKDITTKHDKAACGRKNAQKFVETFPVDFATGNYDQLDDLQLSNSVYNVLKQHSYSEEKKSHRVHEKKEHSTSEQALDSNTRLMMYKIVNSGTLESINGCISTGKEAVVFHANGGLMEGKLVPYECAIKVFKTTLNEFKTRNKYIKDDYRFKDRMRKLNPRKIIKMWAEKEMHNLMRMQKVGIRVPDVVLLRRHVLVMSFIGQDQKPAPKLKQAKLTMEQTKDAYFQCVKMMKIMFQDAKLVHADLSEYNMLWHNDLVWFIDVSQSVEPTHPHALEFLFRDCTNVYQFFSRCGVSNVMKPHQLFNHISQLNLPSREGKDFLLQVQDYELSEEFRAQVMTGKNYAFDYFFEKSVQDEDSNSESDDEEELCDPQ